MRGVWWSVVMVLQLTGALCAVSGVAAGMLAGVTRLLLVAGLASGFGGLDAFLKVAGAAVGLGCAVLLLGLRLEDAVSSRWPGSDRS
jgi:hypothetical protein